MKRSRTALLLITCVLLSTGFADCHFSASSAVYKLKSCPPQDFAWPAGVKSEQLEASKEAPKNQDGECKKLVRYHVKKKVNQRVLLSKIEWSTYDAYLGVVKDGTCKLIVASPWVGPPLSDSQREEGLKKWSADNETLLQLLLTGTPLAVAVPAEKTALMDDKDDYKKWCDGLPLRGPEEK